MRHVMAAFTNTKQRYRPMIKEIRRNLPPGLPRQMLLNVMALMFDAGFKAGMIYGKSPDSAPTTSAVKYKAAQLTPWKPSKEKHK